jgi:hypothetical protein
MARAKIETLDPRKIKLFLDDFKDLGLTLPGGGRYGRITAARAFPLSSPEQLVVLRDQEGNEIGIIENVEQLDKQSSQALKIELEKCYFMPIITYVNNIDEAYGVPKWDVETDRGPRKFELRSRRDARLTGYGRVLIKDIDGNRYEIPDYTQLDARSRAYVEGEV